MDADVVIIGAGAAGMMCALQAGRRGRRVILLDHAAVLGEKIRISGGGRCNFTNLHARPENYLSANPDFCRSALARYTPQDFIALVDRHGIAWHEKKLGQLFCDGSAQQVIDMLTQECLAAGVKLVFPTRVSTVEHDGAFRVTTASGEFRCRALVVATGGLSIPKIGASPFGYRLAEQFGLRVTELRPALVGLTFAPETLAQFADLSGVSLDAVVSCNGARFREHLLITHSGLSGPAILQISSYWRPGMDVMIDLLPDIDAAALLADAAHADKLLASVLALHLPQRFAQRWVELDGENVLVKRLSAQRLRALAALLHAWPVRPSGTVGYKKAEVTLGGVDTRELSSKTMEARNVPGLYFIGEVIDVTGQLGGYNFQWAWASGYAAGQSV